MKPTIAVMDTGGLRDYTVAELPLAIGPAVGAAGAGGSIRLAGKGPAVAFLGCTGGRFFLQPGPGREACSLDHQPLSESHWLDGGEVLLARGCAVRFELDGERLNVRVDVDPEEQITAPPLVTEMPVTPLEAPAERVAISPVAFQRSPVSGGSGESRFPWVGTIVFSGLALLTLAIWFMFSARSVEVIISPSPDHTWISGGFDIPVGSRFLLRPGTYTLHASLEGYEPLADEIEITGERSQTLRRNLERLGDRLFISTAGVESARVLVDGEEAGTTPLADCTSAAGSPSDRGCRSTLSAGSPRSGYRRRRQRGAAGSRSDPGLGRGDGQ